MVSKHIETVKSQDKCKLCDIIFTGRSSRQVCTVCGEKFHKNCFLDPAHLCLGAGTSTSSQVQQPGNMSAGHTPTLAIRNPDTHAIGLNPCAPPFRVSITPSNPPVDQDTGAEGQLHGGGGVVGQTDVSQPSIEMQTGGVTQPSGVSLPHGVQGGEPSPDPVLSFRQPVITQPVQIDSLTQTQRNQSVTQRARQGNKASKNTPAIDKTTFELECLKKQLNIAHTKIVELETELVNAKSTNTILGERIKLFEDTTSKDLFEKYFPRNNTNKNNDNPSSSRPRPCNDCYHHCAPPPCQTLRCYAPHSDTNHSAAISELSEKVDKLGDEMSEIRDEVALILKSAPLNSRTPIPSILQSPSHPSCDYQDVQHDMSVTEDGTTQVLNNTASSDSNTIDEDIPSDIPLNCQVLTT